jgi:hypothetical protein
MPLTGPVSPVGAHPPPPPPAGPSAPAAAGAAAGRLGSLLASTPARLSALSTLSVVALLAFGIVGALAVNARASALADARATAEQLVRLQAIRTNLVQANAAATNAYLAGGLEVPDQRDRYRTSVTAAAHDLAAAAHAAADADEAGALGRVGESLATYTGLIEAARANNRQFFPVGAAYLRQGSTLLRTDVLPVLAGASDATANRVLDAYDASDRAAAALAVVAAAALAVLAGGQLWLARRMHRVLNVPLAAATGAVAVAAIVALGVMGWAQSRAEDVRQGPYAATAALAAARVAAFDAKSAESLTLILQNSGGGDSDWKALDEQATSQLAVAEAGGPHPLADAYGAWRAVHQDIRGLDDGGDWRGAVARATGTGADSSNARFGDFAGAAQGRLDAQVTSTRDGLGATHLPLVTAGLLTLVAGIAAAVAAWWGYARRLEEYR